MSKYKTVKTYTATIYCGLREGYTETERSYDVARGVCQSYCDEIGLCVSVELIEFFYTDGHENGVAVRLINYPRFPESKQKILKKALRLAKILMVELCQNRVSVVCCDKTYMMEVK